MWSVDRFCEDKGTDLIQNWTWELSGFSATGELPGVSESQLNLLSKEPCLISAAFLPWRNVSISVQWKYIARLQHLTVYLPRLAIVYYIWSIKYGKSYYSARKVSFQTTGEAGYFGSDFQWIYAVTDAHKLSRRQKGWSVVSDFQNSSEVM